MKKDLEKKFQEYREKKRHARKKEALPHRKHSDDETALLSKKFHEFRIKKEKKLGFFSRLMKRPKHAAEPEKKQDMPEEAGHHKESLKNRKNPHTDDLHKKYKDLLDDLKRDAGKKESDMPAKIEIEDDLAMPGHREAGKGLLARLGLKKAKESAPETAKQAKSEVKKKDDKPEATVKPGKKEDKENIKEKGKEKDKKKDKEDVKETDLRKLFRKKEKEKRKKVTAAERKRRLADYLEKAGLEIDHVTASRRMFYSAIALTTLMTGLYIYFAVQRGGSVTGIIIQVLVLWVFGFLFVWGASRLVFMIYLDLLMFRRKLSVEEVLPDFLQLTSANIRAGMPIDRALWFAVRPRFGVLAKEIEDVAKRTLAGEELSVALVNFAKRYDSLILLRSVYLLNEGMDAGGDVGDLLNKIALNIQDMRGMKKEMSANVTTYVIFISFAAMIAAPFLFGLSNQLLHIVQSIAGDVAAGGGIKGGGIGLSINMSSDNIKMSDYRIFAYSCLAVSSIFSAVIVATIKKGNVKEGLQYIPIYLIVSLIVFYFASVILGTLMGGMF